LSRACQLVRAVTPGPEPCSHSTAGDDGSPASFRCSRCPETSTSRVVITESAVGDVVIMLLPRPGHLSWGAPGVRTRLPATDLRCLGPRRRFRLASGHHRLDDVLEAAQGGERPALHLVEFLVGP